MKYKQNHPDVEYIRNATQRNPRGQLCANCRFYKFYSDSCELVESNLDAPILATGYCKQWREAPTYEETRLDNAMPVRIINGPEAGDGPGVGALVENEPVNVAMAQQGGKEAQTIEPPTAQPGETESPNRSDSTIETAEQKGIRKVFQNLIDRVKGAADNAPALGLKALGNGYWFAVYTNNFIDRDGEILAAKAHERYIARVDKGHVPLPELWVYHLPGTKHGQALAMGIEGNFVWGAGKFDDSDFGRMMEKYYREKKPGELALSHGFTYPKWAKVKGVYWDYNTYEITTLAPDHAANPFAPFTVLEDEILMDKAKKDAILATFGEKIGGEIIARAEQAGEAGKSLVAANVAFKEYVDRTAKDPTEPAQTAEKSGGDSDGGAWAEVFEAQAALSETVKALTDLQESQMGAIVAQLAEIKTALGFVPVPASKAADTKVPETDPQAAAAKETVAKKEDLPDNPYGMFAGMFDQPK